MEVADPATGTSYNWSLCVCGDVKKIFGVLVEKTTTVLELKNVIEHKSKIPRAEQTLFFEEKPMQDDLDLSSYSELRDGAIIYLLRRSIVLKINNLLPDAPDEFTVTFGHDILEQSVLVMKTVICSTADINPDTCFLLCAGEVLDEELNVSNYPAIKDGAKVLMQKRPVVVSLQREIAKFTTTMPQGINQKFVNQWVSLKTGATQNQLKCRVHEGIPLPDDQQLLRDCDIDLQPVWHFDVQGLDGVKKSVFTRWKKSTPIVVLKWYIEKVTKVPTHQQRLTIGSTVLEDWDHDDNMMFIGHYPAIQNGSLVHIIIKTQGLGFRVKVKFLDGAGTLVGTNGYSFKTRVFFINTSYDESAFSVEEKIRCCTQIDIDLNSGDLDPDEVIEI